MAVNTSRSMNAELAEGRTDGMLNKVVQDRSGEVDVSTRLVRQTLHPERGYGYVTVDPPVQFHGDELIPR